MNDTAPQPAGGKVLWHFTMSLDGFVAGPDNEMDWMTGFSARPGLVDEYAETTGAILGGRNGWDAYPDANATYGGAWHGPLFVLTHHPEDATLVDGVTFLDCDPGRGGADRAGGGRRQEPRSVVAHHRCSASRTGSIDEIDLHIAPILLGEGIRLYDSPGTEPIRLHLVGEGDPTLAVNVRYRPTTTVKIPTE